MMARVSVIIPAFNGEKYISEAINSVKNQTYKDWELVVVDDCSVDGTLKKVFEATKDIPEERKTILKNEWNRGISQTLNRGIDAAWGEFISFLDQDDVYLHLKLERQIDFLEAHPECDLVYGDLVVLGTGKLHKNPPYTREMQKRVNCIPSCSPLIRRRVFDAGIRFDPKLTCCQDWDLWIQIGEAGFKICYQPIPTYLYRFHPRQKSLDNEAMMRDKAYIKKKWGV